LLLTRPAAQLQCSVVAAHHQLLLLLTTSLNLDHATQSVRS
jgi:hypothetical protein